VKGLGFLLGEWKILNWIYDLPENPFYLMNDSTLRGIFFVGADYIWLNKISFYVSGIPGKYHCKQILSSVLLPSSILSGYMCLTMQLGQKSDV
jgi:hypothetical protein